MRKYQIICGSYLLAVIKKFPMKNLNLLLFLTYVPVTLVKSKLQIHPVNPTNPESAYKNSKFVLHWVGPKMVDIMEFIR